MDLELRQAFLEATVPPHHEDWSLDSPSAAGDSLRSAIEEFRPHLIELVREVYEGPQDALDENDPSTVVAFSIVSLECLRRQYEFELALLVAQGLCYGLSWQQMAALLGMKRQSLHKRLSGHVKMISDAVESLDLDELRDAASSQDSQPPLQPLADLIAKKKPWQGFAPRTTAE